MALFSSCMPFRYYKSWRKTSKCKELVEQVLYRLKFIQARKSTIVTQTREDISMLLKLDQVQLAVKLAGELHREQTRIAAYEIIHEICDYISKNVSEICKTRDLPTDANVAVSSLIFAASRCGEIPELNKLRNLFRDWFGSPFDAVNVNLLSSNLVKSELRKTLSTDSISDAVKLELIDEIIRDSSITAHQVHEEQDRRTVQKPEAVSALDKTLSPRESSDSTYQILETEFVCPSRHHDTQVQVPSQNSRTHRRRTPLCSSVSVQPLPQHCRRWSSVNTTEPVQKTRASRKLCQVSLGQVRNCIHHQSQSTVSGSCKGHRRHGDNPSLAHVHPNLPRYEDLEANLKDHRPRYQSQ